MDRLQRVVIAAALLASSSAFAQLSGAAPQYLTLSATSTGVVYSGGAGAPPPSASREITRGTVASPSASVKDSLSFNGPAGVAVAGMFAVRAVPIGAIGGALASCIGIPACLVGTAAMAAGAAYVMDRNYRVRDAARTDHPDLPGGLGYDEGQAPISTTVTQHRCGPSTLLGQNTYGYGPTYLAACSQLLGYHTPSGGAANVCGGAPGCYQTITYRAYSGAEGVTLGVERKISISWNTGSSEGNWTLYPWESGDNVTQVQQNGCPAYVDPFNGGFNVPAGGPLGADGKCPTGRYSQTNAELVAAMVAAHTPQVDADLQQMYEGFDDWLHGGNVCERCPTVPAFTSGPATVTTPAVTTTTTDATGTTSEAKTDTYSMVYGGSAANLGTNPAPIQWPSKATTTASTFTASSGPNAGVPVTTTSTTTVQTQSAAEAAAAAAVTQCDKYPGSAACATLNEAEDVPLPTSTINASVAPDSGWGADNGTCPALVQTQSIGAVDPYGMFCTYASGIRFIVIGFAGIIATLIFIGRIE